GVHRRVPALWLAQLAVCRRQVLPVVHATHWSLPERTATATTAGGRSVDDDVTKNRGRKARACASSTRTSTAVEDHRKARDHRHDHCGGHHRDRCAGGIRVASARRADHRRASAGRLIEMTNWLTTGGEVRLRTLRGVTVTDVSPLGAAALLYAALN